MKLWIRTWLIASILAVAASCCEWFLHIHPLAIVCSLASAVYVGLALNEMETTYWRDQAQRSNRGYVELLSETRHLRRIETQARACKGRTPHDAK